MKPRKGARRISEIPPHILEALNRGELSTVNLVEGLAVDQVQLLQSVLPAKYHSQALLAIQQAPKQTSIALIKVIGKVLCEATIEQGNRQEWEQLITLFLERDLDIPLSWGAMMVGYAPLSLEDKMNALQPFAAHHHFQVREIAWMGLREDVIAYPEQALQLLYPWSLSEDENLRRFTTEVTRPKGVWCKQFGAIQKAPALALPILENLKADASKYVQNSVANWLNDLSKTNPAWVVELCNRWEQELPHESATAYIIRRALRTVAASS